VVRWNGLRLLTATSDCDKLKQQKAGKRHLGLHWQELQTVTNSQSTINNQAIDLLTTSDNKQCLANFFHIEEDGQLQPAAAA
jgi:hypothetical protein